MVSGRHTGHAGPDLAHDPGPLMAENCREHAFRIRSGQGEGVGMADTGGHDLDKNLALAGTVKIDFHDFKRLAGSNRNSGTRLHLHFLPWRRSCDGVSFLPSRWHDDMTGTRRFDHVFPARQFYRCRRPASGWKNGRSLARASGLRPRM